MIVPDNNENIEQTAPVETTIVGVKTCEDIRYKKYFKMIQFGVPASAVKLKMDAEGIDPTLLEYVLLFELHLPILTKFFFSEPNRILENGIAPKPDE